MSSRSLAERSLRWLARAWSVASLVTIVLIAAGEPAVPSVAECAGLALFPIGVAVGLLLAWRHEAIGGMLALACLGGFYLWNLGVTGRFPSGPWFALLAAPAALFLVLAALRRAGARPAP